MTVDRVRAYARKTAKELLAASVQPDSWTEGGGTRKVTEKRWGFLTRTTTVDVPVRTAVQGWRVWSQAMTTVETVTFGNISGFTEQREIWLAPNGDLLSVQTHVSIWSPGASLTGMDLSDRVVNVEPASDSDITLADLPYHYQPRPPRVPSYKKDGYYESHVGIRRSDPLPPGMRISQGLTALRKAKGTYIQRPQSRKH